MVINIHKRMTQAIFGDLLGVSQQTVSELLSREVLTPGATADVWIKEYVSHLREMAAGRAASGDLDLATERARLAKEHADKLAMQNAVTRRELAPTFLLEQVLAKAGSRAGAILDTIPGMVKRRVPSLSADDIAAIAREVAKVRNIAASMTLADLPDDDQDEEHNPAGMPEQQPAGQEG